MYDRFMDARAHEEDAVRRPEELRPEGPGAASADPRTPTRIELPVDSRSLAGLRLGSGFDSINSIFRGEGAVTGNSSPSDNTIQEAKTELTIIESYTHLREALKVSASVSMGGVGSARASIVMASELTEYWVYLLVHCWVILAPTSLEHQQASPALQQSVPPAAFMSRWGNLFCDCYWRGGELIGVIRCQATSESELFAAKAAARAAKGAFDDADASVSAAVTALEQQTHVNIDVLTYTWGGKGPATQSLSDLVSAAASFRDSVDPSKQGNPQPWQISLVDYGVVGVEPPDVKAAEAMFTRIGRLHDRILGLTVSIQFAKANPAQFSSLSPAQLSQLLGLITRAAWDAEDHLGQIVSTLRGDPVGAPATLETQLDYVAGVVGRAEDELPQRDVTLAFAVREWGTVPGAKTQGTPGLAALGDRLYCAFRGAYTPRMSGESTCMPYTTSEDVNLYFATYAGTPPSWSAASSFASAGSGSYSSAAGPALATSQGASLFCVYRWSDNDNLNMTVLPAQGGRWPATQAFFRLASGGWRTATAPALSTPPFADGWNATMFCAHRANDSGDQRLWLTGFDGQKWSPDKLMAPGGDDASNPCRSAVGPALAGFNGMLYCAFRGASEDTNLYVSTLAHEGQAWETSAMPHSASPGQPALVVWGDVLICLYVRSDSQVALSYLSPTTSATWSQEIVLPLNGCVGLSAAVFEEHLFCAYRGSGGDVDQQLQWARIDRVYPSENARTAARAAAEQVISSS